MATGSSPTKLTIGVVDDHPLYREGVAATLKADPCFNVVGVGSCGEDAVEIARQHKPQLLLLDFNMNNGGLPLISRLSTEYPSIKIVILTVSEREQDVSESLHAGARGYILKNIAGADLRQTLLNIASGEAFVMPELAAKLLSAIHNRTKVTRVPSALEDLNAREEFILDRVASGQTNKEIARELNLSEKTVKHYMTTIMQKLHVRNRVEAVSLLLQRDGQNGQTGQKR
jgi:two-component system, NarL family, nitrate/nitrite response regulator NarL